VKYSSYLFEYASLHVVDTILILAKPKTLEMMVRSQSGARRQGECAFACFYRTIAGGL